MDSWRFVTPRILELTDTKEVAKVDRRDDDQMGRDIHLGNNAGRNDMMSLKSEVHAHHPGKVIVRR